MIFSLYSLPNDITLLLTSDSLVDKVETLYPQASIQSFSESASLLHYLSNYEHSLDIIITESFTPFLSQDLTTSLKEIYPQLKIIITNYSEATLFEMTVYGIHGIILPSLSLGKIENLLTKLSEDIIALRREHYAQKKYEQSLRYEKMGEIIASIAHQWRQPINAINSEMIRLQLGLELGKIHKEEISELCERINFQTQKMSRTINSFLNFFKPSIHKETFNIDEVIEDLQLIFEQQFRKYSIELSFQTLTDIKIHSFRNELLQVFINLISNAKDAFEQGTQIKKYVHFDTSCNNQEIVFHITDSAGGIPDDIIEMIFQPYFTTKNPNKGTGLGLHICKTLVEETLGGTLSVENYENGARFTVKIPLSLDK